MSADLHIHVLTDDFTEEIFKLMEATTIGSKYQSLDIFVDPRQEYEKEHGIKVYDIVEKSPNVWVGSVSWLKAALFEDENTFIPDTVQEVSDMIGEDFPIIDDELILKVRNAFNLPNNTVKEDGVWNGKGYRLAKVKDVVTFLESHKGEKVVTISW